MRWVRTKISSIYYFTEILIILKQHIQSDRTQTDGQTNGVTPIYPQKKLCCAGGIIIDRDACNCKGLGVSCNALCSHVTSGNSHHFLKATGSTLHSFNCNLPATRALQRSCGIVQQPNEMISWCDPRISAWQEWSQLNQSLMHKNDYLKMETPKQPLMPMFISVKTKSW